MQQGAPRHILAPRSQDRAMPTGLNLTGKPMQLLLTLMSSGAQVLEQVGASPHQAQHLRPLPVGLRLAPGHLPSGTSSERGMAFHVHCVLLRSRWLLRSLDVHHELHVPRLCFGPGHLPSLSFLSGVPASAGTLCPGTSSWRRIPAAPGRCCTTSWPWCCQAAFPRR